MKYIQHKTHGFIVFPNEILHDEMAESLVWPKDDIESAGLVTHMSNTLHCFGVSATLMIGSKDSDTDDLHEQLRKLP